jgi:hypothetical protein
MQKLFIIGIILLLLCSLTLAAKNNKPEQKTTGKEELQQSSDKLSAKEQNPKPDDKTMVEKTYPGFISDVLCGSAAKDPAGNDLSQNPGLHSLACMKAPDCAASGYGVFIRTTKGYYKFYKLDAKGSDLAKMEIINKTKKKSNIYILVKGTINRDDILTANSIKEAKLSKGKNDKDKSKKDVIDKKGKNHKEDKI